MQNIAQRTTRFIEQAEYIDKSDFKAWSATHPNESEILKKLSSVGAKLITGPRGCGKTTLLLKAYNNLLTGNGQGTLPVYTNYKTSLRIEPLYHKNANANYWFNQWLVIKIILGLIETLDAIGTDLPEMNWLDKRELKSIRDKLELGYTDFSNTAQVTFDVSLLKSLLHKAMEITGRKRCVLFLDDAAHAFSADQQRDFFDFFRRVKSREISPKAAIYPGVTIYSSSFHVGHDAEEVDVWVRPDSNKYLDFMHQLLRLRLDDESMQMFNVTPELVNLVCYASFGIPRNLLNSARSLLDADERDDIGLKSSLTRSLVLKEVKASCESTLLLYNSLKIKLPIYEEFIIAGDRILRRAIDALKNYNRDKNINRKSVDLAIKEPIAVGLEKTLAFMEYAGLIFPKGKVSRGVKGVFHLYTIHYGLLIDRNALLATRAPNVSDIVEAFGARNAHEFTRLSTDKLLGGESEEKVFRLSLPPCEVCGTPRVSEDAKFCMNCGSALKIASTFESLVNQPIDNLPLTTARISRIKDNSPIRLIKDILVDQGQNKLRKVPWVGPVWAKRIYSYAEEYIA